MNKATEKIIELDISNFGLLMGYLFFSVGGYIIHPYLGATFMILIGLTNMYGTKK